MSHSDRSCHSIKSLCCRDFVFVQWLTGESRQRFASLICYHLHVEHTHGSLMLTWNTGSAMCRTSKVQSAKVIPSHYHTRTKGCSALSCSVLFHVFILGLLMRRVINSDVLLCHHLTIWAELLLY